MKQSMYVASSDILSNDSSTKLQWSFGHTNCDGHKNCDENNCYIIFLVIFGLSEGCGNLAKKIL